MTTDKTIKSKYQPKQTNVTWIDLSGETPVEKHFINGQWVAVSGGGGGGGGDTSQIYKVDDILHIPAEMLESCKVGDIFTEKSMPTGFPSDYNGIYQVEAKTMGGVYLFFHSYFYDYNVSSDQGFEPSFGFLVYSNMWGNWESRWYPLDYLTLKDSLIHVANTIPNDGMRPNTLYNLGELTSDTTFTMASTINNTLANVWTWTFSTGSTAPTITWPAQITMWSNGEAPEIEANKYYEVSVMNGVGTVISADIPQEEPEVEP